MVIKMLFEHDGFKRLRTEGNVAAHQLDLEDAQFFLDGAGVPNRRQLTLMVKWFLEASEPVPAIYSCIILCISSLNINIATG
jgi:hypothetical protein